MQNNNNAQIVKAVRASKPKREIQLVKTGVVRNQANRRIVSKINRQIDQSKLTLHRSSLDNKNQWIESHHDNEFKYAIGLLHPWKGISERVPTPMPVPTATCSLRGTINLTANASGYFMAYLNPWLGSGGNVLSYNNNALFTSDAYAYWGTLSSSVAGLNTLTNMIQYRIVSAGLKARDLSTPLSVAGLVRYGCIPYLQATTGTANADTINDSIMVEAKANVDCRDFLGGVFLPTGTDAMNLLSAGASLTSHVIPIVYFAGVAPNATICLEYCINYEFIPASNQTDLLSVSYPPSGTMEGALSKVGRLITLDNGTAKQLRNTVAKGPIESGYISKLLHQAGHAIVTRGLPMAITALHSILAG